MLKTYSTSPEFFNLSYIMYKYWLKTMSDDAIAEHFQITIMVSKL